jgi:hypothetical protein
MNSIKQIEEILQESNKYDTDLSFYNSAICYISFFEKASEKDYIIYRDGNRFEYTPQFYSFIHGLYKANLVASHDEMKDFLSTFNCIATEKLSCYMIWVREMNKILADEKKIKRTNISFLRKALSTMLNLEKIFPGSWGIDVENGNFLRILRQLKAIYPQIYSKGNTSVC